MTSILELMATRGIRVKRMASTKGGEYAGPCPGCGGEDRFRIWPNQNDGEGSWWCRQCDKGGDAIQFLMDFSNMSYREACRELDKPFSEYNRIPAPQPAVEKPAWQPKNIAAPQGVNTALWRKKAAKFVSRAHGVLLQDAAKLEWLAERRGIVPETVKRFKLGWNAGEKDKSAIFRPRESWGLPVETKKDGRKKMLCIPRGLVIPYLNGDVPLRIRIRRPRADIEKNRLAKYYVVPGSVMAPMLLGIAARAFIAVESELDSILLYQETGDLAGCIAIGSASAKPDAGSDAILKQCLAVLVALDFDGAGARAAWNWWQKTYSRAERWPVPQGKDPGEAFQKGVDLKQWVFAGLPPALRIGHSPLESKKIEKGGRLSTPLPRKTSTDKTLTSDFPPAVVELYDLLKKYHVKVLVTPQRTAVKPKDYGPWDKLKRISELVFFDNEVIGFLHGHPDGVINADNFWKVR